MHNSKSHGGPNIFFDISKGQSWYVLTHSYNVFTKERSKINKIWGFAGQIKSFRGPHVAHACCKQTYSSEISKVDKAQESALLVKKVSKDSYILRNYDKVYKKVKEC